MPETERGPFRVQVRAGKKVSVVYSNGGRAVDKDIADEIPTISELFDSLKTEGNGDVANIEIEIDERLGYPKTSVIAQIGDGEHDEISITFVRDVEILSVI